MAASALRRRAVTLLCVAVTLAAVLVRGDTTDLTGTTTLTGKSFSGETFVFKMTSDSTVQLTGSQVSGAGLTLDGTSSSVTGRLTVDLVSTTVSESTIVFNGPMPANSRIRAVSTTGSLASSQSLFTLQGLRLESNASVIIENSAATWPSGTNTGSVVIYTPGSNGAGINTSSSLFVLNATATNGASVLNIDTRSSFKVTSDSALAVDYCRCTTCSSALVTITDPLTVDTASLFRVANGTVTGGSANLLTSAVSTTVNGNSLYLISNSIVTNAGALFKFITGLDDDTVSYPFAVTSSTASFLNLQAAATGVSASSPVPNSIDSATVTIGGGCVIGGSSLTASSQYTSNGLKVSTVVSSNGASGSKCANAQCMPSRTSAGGAAPSTGNCACTCSSNSYSSPACTTVSDPTLTYDATPVCNVPHCTTCDRPYPAKCLKCDANYQLNSQQTCGETTTTTTTTTRTTTRTTTTAAPTCSVAYCTKCVANSGTTCSTCKSGYHITGGRCVLNSNAAAAAHSAVLAAAVCVAAAVYAL